MTENVSERETIYKKLEDLDSEINAFVRAVREIKEIREAAGGLPERLQDHETEIENQKKRLDTLLSATHDVLITFEEKSREVICDLEKRAGDMTGELQSRIEEFERKFSRSSEQFNDGDGARLQQLDNTCKALHEMVSENERSINTVKNNYMKASGILDRLESSFDGMERNILALQRRPYETENKMIKMEERLMALIDKKHKSQKTFSWMLLIILIAGTVLSFTVFYLR